jgi:hypothetical protein
MSFFHFLASVKRTLEERRGGRKSINLGIASANNHYAGFGPGTANIFRKMVDCQNLHGVRKRIRRRKKDKSHLHSSIQDPKQSTISDFMS